MHSCLDLSHEWRPVVYRPPMHIYDTETLSSLSCPVSPPLLVSSTQYRGTQPVRPTFSWLPLFGSACPVLLPPFS